MKVWVKICGVTRVEDALLAVEAGADAVGINFCESSTRYCPRERAAAIVAEVGARVAVYGVFVSAPRQRISEIVRSTGIGGIQFHGGESARELRGWELPVIRALRVGDRGEIEAALAVSQHCRVLLDSPIGGGSGNRFDPSLVTGLDLSQVIVAGGLTPANVSSVIRELMPFGVDCASGVEVRPGVKNPRLVREFIRNAKTA